MLTSLVLQLQAPSKAVLPASLGRAGQALLLRLIAERDAPLAKELHEGNKRKPYTVSNLLLGKRKQGSLYIEAGQEGWLRFTGLTPEVGEQLAGMAAAPPEAVELDGHGLTVTGATLDPAENGWAGQISYQDLAAPFLLGGREKPNRRIELEFASPTTFRSKGHSMPLPLPELVFGSLLDRWQSFSPIALHPDLRRFAAEAVVLSRYRLRTRGMPHKEGMMQIGFMGQATFLALNRDQYWLNVLQLLAAFAFYSGVGYLTAAGFGQVRSF